MDFVALARAGRSAPLVPPVVQVRTACLLSPFRSSRLGSLCFIQIFAKPINPGFEPEMAGPHFYFLFSPLTKRAGPNANGGSSALVPAFSISIKPKFRMSRGNCTEKSCPGTLTAHAPNTQYQPYWILKVSEYRIHPRTLAGRHEHPINARRKLGYRASVRGKCTETADPSAMKAESAGLLSVSRNS